MQYVVDVYRNQVRQLQQLLPLYQKTLMAMLLFSHLDADVSAAAACLGNGDCSGRHATEVASVDFLA